jgi:hypothetical protein
MNKRYRTDFLSGNNNFLIGMASVFNFGGNFFEYNESESSEEADKKAIENDWNMIEQDIQDVIENYGK